MKNIFILLVLTFAFFACENRNENIDNFIKDKSSVTKYVIEGQVSTTSSRHHVVITKPKELIGDQHFQGVSGAIVTLSDGTSHWTFSELAPEHLAYKHLRFTSGIYESNDYFRGFAGKTYTLTVTIDGKTYTAAETMPVAEKATETELAALPTIKGEHAFGQSKAAIWSSSPKNSDKFEIFLDTRLNFHTKKETEGVHADKIHNFFGRLTGGNAVRYSITTEFADYVWAYFAETEWQGSVFSSESSKLPSNFNNPDVSGYFSCVSHTRYLIDGSFIRFQDTKTFTNKKSFEVNYTSEGAMKIEFYPEGNCVLRGLNQEMSGTYELIDDTNLTVHFHRQYQKSASALYHLYRVNINGAIPGVDPATGNMSYLDLRKLGFQYINNVGIKSADDKIWQ